MSRRRTALALQLATSLALLLSGCQSQPVEAPPAPVRVENATLGVAFTELPAGITVVKNEGSALELAAADDAGAGRVTVTVGPRRDTSINLVEEAKAFGAEAEAAGGTFYGGNELVTPYGSAYTVRAAVDGGALEERRILMVHPSDADRLLTVTLSYPPGDNESARRRLQQMLELVTALEPLGAAPAAS